MTKSELIRTTCPRDCYDACGVVVLKRNGAVAQVRGDRDHFVARGKLCRKCSIAYNGALLDPMSRLTRPLRRSGPKGEGRFEPVSWDEALAAIAGRLEQIVAGPGPGTILNAHYTGTFSLLAYFFPLRFFHRLGATEVDPDTICNKAGHVALEYVYGTSLVGFDPRTARDSACILVWARIRRLPLRTRTAIGCQRRPDGSLSSTRYARRRLRSPTSTCSRSRAATPLSPSAFCT